MDAALIAKCADPSLPPAIVEQFISAVGSDDPLAVTVNADGRLVLIPKPRSPDEAMGVVKNYVGHAIVRVGITQFPADVGVDDASQLQSDMFEACANLRTGTGIFAKVARIVTKWYGRPTNKELLPQLVDDTIYAWKTGSFEGDNVFRASDPGGPTFFGTRSEKRAEGTDPVAPPMESEDASQPAEPDKATEAGMRIDLSRIGGQK
ncbi:TraH family protein [Rhizobium favelukesii]|uniref:TraH n=1 Tax=Rhizobium favelukesii TaxID=348824 RepID=V5RFU0_9HYPH|nr:TraH family protein [Rhizobium favelukesii]AHB33423.1 TraH [Rhizobium favelukesii]MCS0461179.1 conjugal transfer protein TraH [Rhizobium favelukesii]CDM59985.1 conjugal transfer protein TraH [Rhizobium favelukesii]